MMRLLPVAIAFALTASAFAQPPTSGIDWTRPVTGVDGAIPIKGEIIVQVIPVAVDAATMATNVGFRPLDTPQPPPCDPPAAGLRRFLRPARDCRASFPGDRPSIPPQSHANASGHPRRNAYP